MHNKYGQLAECSRRSENYCIKKLQKEIKEKPKLIIISLCSIILSDPYPNMLAMSRHVQLPPRFGLPDVNATLQNVELWQQFHEIGNEMIITKSGR